MSNLTFRIGAIVSLLLLLIGFVSLVWTPAPLEQREVLSLAMRGLLTSYIVPAIGIAIGLFIGVPLGLAAAVFGGIAARVVDPLRGFVAIIPALAIAAVIATLAGPGPLNVMAAVGIASIPIFAAAALDAARALLARPYMDAARLAGLSRWDVAGRHAFPVLAPFLLAQALAQFSFAVLAEAALSYAGIGAAANGTSLGLLLKTAQSSILFEPLQALAPGLAICAVAGALQVAASGLRHSIDPALRMSEHDDALA